MTTRTSSKRTGFTLIELLTVVAIIMILAGLLFPTIRGALRKAEITQAKAEIKAIETAIRSYFTEYGKLPVRDALQGQADNSCYFLTSPEQYQLINTLMAISYGDNNNNVLNPRKIPFLDAPSRKNALSNQGTQTTFNDPWAKPYAIKFDCNYDNVVDYYGNRNGIAVILSYGPNGIQEDPNVSTCDDVFNFR
jgi:prepilin-type N-terminal cleavage/methylation domain-containing protein